HSRDAALDTNRLVAHLNVTPDLGTGLVYVLAICVTVDQCALSRAASEHLVQGHARKLRHNVPQRDIDRGNGRHGHRAATPIRTAIQELPRIFDASRIAADEIGNHVLLQVSGNRQLATVEGGIAETVYARARLDLQRDEIAPRTGDNHLGRCNRTVASRTLRLSHSPCSYKR